MLITFWQETWCQPSVRGNNFALLATFVCRKLFDSWMEHTNIKNLPIHCLQTMNLKHFERWHHCELTPLWHDTIVKWHHCHVRWITPLIILKNLQQSQTLCFPFNTCRSNFLTDNCSHWNDGDIFGNNLKRDGTEEIQKTGSNLRMYC